MTSNKALNILLYGCNNHVSFKDFLNQEKKLKKIWKYWEY